MSFFTHFQNVPPDAVFGLQVTYRSDTRKEKVNLAIGVYQDEKGQTPTLSTVRTAEKKLLEENPCREYLPIDGYRPFLQQVGPLVFGKDLWQNFHSSIYLAQAVGGTGSLRIAAELIKQAGKKEIYVPSPTWANHHGIFKAAGLHVMEYFYYDYQSNHMVFSEFYDFLRNMPEESVVLLHGVCHNPTGLDPTEDQWKTLAKLFIEKKFFPVFDFAYQGFGESIDRDRKSIETFVEAGIPLFVCYSFSKNFGLYGERIGTLAIVTGSKDKAEAIGSNVRKIIRESYSNPPMHGALIIEKVLSDTVLRKEWEKEVIAMKERASKMKATFLQELSQSLPRINQNAKGLFCYLALSKEITRRLIEEEALYLSSDGRINVTGLNPSNIDIVLKKIHKVLG